MTPTTYPWPGPDEGSIIEEMLADHGSQHWHTCYRFVQRYLLFKGWTIHNLSREDIEEIVQEAMFRIYKSLPAFKRKSKLTTWLTVLSYRSLIDFYRKSKPSFPIQPPISACPLTTGIDEPLSVSHHTPTAEELAIINNDLSIALATLKCYCLNHAHAGRNARIIELVILRGNSCESAAKETDCSPAIVSYVVRSARNYLRSSLDESQSA